ncbi:MAG: hypothetical protein KF778_16200 [Rhodocyclaceae bacterium]|nr:hypothetical protein [Rhodocyclaceae bacterium]MBX3669944.1 hypothetical protein [Rhodocyclaceae bacterium]
MKRRLVWATVAALALLVLGGVWFIQNFEQYERSERTGYSPEALRDRYLALGRFVERMGRHFEKSGDPATLDGLAPGGIVILDRGRERRISGARMAALLRWVEAGGLLIAVPEIAPAEDPLAQQFDVARSLPAAAKKPAADTSADDEDEADAEANSPAADAAPKPEQPATSSQAPAAAGEAPAQQTAPAAKPAAAAEVGKRWQSTLYVQLPGSARQFKLRTFFPGMQAGKIVPAWRADGPEDRAQILHYTHGKGGITFVAGLDFKLSNHSIGEHDHAALLWALMADTAGPVRLITRIQVPSLWSWLAGPGASALYPLLAGLVAWIWYVAPRLGPLLPATPPERRSLSEHLAACGRAVRRAHGHAAWAERLRDILRRRLELRHPELAAGANLPAALAAQTGLAAAAVQHALAGDVRQRHAFVQAVQTLHLLLRKL